VAKQAIRVQTINDSPVLKGITANIGSLAADANNVYGILSLSVFNQGSVPSLLSVNHAACTLADVPLLHTSQQGLALDPINHVAYYNYILVTNNVSTSGIQKVSYNGLNTSTLFQYPSLNASGHWLSLDYQKQILYSSDASHQVSVQHLNNVNVLSTIRTTGCTTAACDVNIAGSTVDVSTGRLYYPDSQGIVSFDPATNITNRVLLTPNLQVKTILIDVQNGLLFLQMSGITLQRGAFVDPVYVATLNVATSTADPKSLVQVPGVLTVDLIGNTLALTDCNTTTCGICGYQYTFPFNPSSPISTTTAPAVQLTVSLALLAALLIILQF